MLKIINISTATDQGPRDYQQDRFFFNDKLFVIADGMGGLPSGDKAAETVISEVSKVQNVNDETIHQALESASNICHATLDKRGTTAVVAFVDDTDVLHVHWCGDSRAYVWHADDGLKQLTSDHGYMHYLSIYIGDTFYGGEIVKHPLKAGSVVMLTTDGIHDYLNDVSTPLRAAQALGTPIADSLVSQALNWTRDNCTAVCFEVK